MTYIDSQTAEEALTWGDGKGPRFDAPIPTALVDFVMNDPISMGFSKDSISCEVMELAKTHPYHLVIEPEDEDSTSPHVARILADCRKKPKFSLWGILKSAIRQWWRQ